jgi:hypothetical protein
VKVAGVTVPLVPHRRGAQQRRIIALPGPRAHARGRSHTHMHSLSQQQADPVPIMQNKSSQDTGQRGYPRSVNPPRIRAPHPPAVTCIHCACPPRPHGAPPADTRTGRPERSSAIRSLKSGPQILNSHSDAREIYTEVPSAATREALRKLGQWPGETET